jgi:hypothetical protein
MRTWLHQILLNTPALTDIIGDRVAQSEARTSSVGTKPYLFHTLGVKSNQRFSESQLIHRQFFQIYVHDEPGDYSRIDQICDILVTTLDQAVDEAYGIIRVEHLETSTDLDDMTLGTILRYIRFAALIKKE